VRNVGEKKFVKNKGHVEGDMRSNEGRKNTRHSKWNVLLKNFVQ